MQKTRNWLRVHHITPRLPDLIPLSIHYGHLTAFECGYFTLGSESSDIAGGAMLGLDCSCICRSCVDNPLICK